MAEEEKKPAASSGSGFGPVGGWGAGGPPVGFGFGPMASMPQMQMPPMMPYRGRGWRGRGWRGRGWRGRGRGGRGGGVKQEGADPTEASVVLDDDDRKTLNEVCTTVMSLRNKLSPTDKQRLNSALAHLRKVGTPSAKVVEYKAATKYSRGVELDRPGSDKMKECLLIMKAVVKDLPEAHEKHRVVAEHVVSNLTKLVKENCTMGPDDEMKYDGPDDGLSRAKAAKKVLQEVPEDLMSEKQLRNYNATINTIQAFVSRVTDRNYRPAKVKWLLQNSATYENPDWKPVGRPAYRERSRSPRRERSRERRRRRRRSRSR